MRSERKRGCQEIMDFEEIKWWFEDNWKTVVGFLAILAVVGLTFLMFYVEADRRGELPDSYEEQIQTLQTGSEEIKETFSLLDQIDTSSFEGQVVYDITLYNKKPFIDSGDLEQVLRTYIETLHIVEGTYDREVRAVRFTIYDRKIKYDLGAKPDGVYYYAIPYISIPEGDKEDEQGRYYNMSGDQVAYDYTSLYAPSKIDHSIYSLFGNYTQLRRKPGVEPMSDQEYNWFVKLDTYTELGADSGSMYLEWELGAPRSSSVARLFRQDVRTFRQRLSALGAEPTLFGNDGIRVQDLKHHLVIDNPSFLWFAETGQVEENAIRARALLVEEYPGMYQQVVQNWVQSLAEEQVDMMNRGEDPATSGANKGEDSYGGLGEEDAPRIGGDKRDPLGNIDEVDDSEEIGQEE